MQPKNAKELEQAMSLFLEDADLKESLKTNARKVIEDFFDKNLVWEELKKEYELVIQ